MDSVLALHAGSRGFNSHRGHMSERVFRSNRPGYPHPEWRSVIAVSLNVGGGVRLIKPAKLYMCTQLYKYNEDGHTAPGVCGNGSVPLSHSGNVVTRTGIHTPPSGRAAKVAMAELLLYPLTVTIYYHSVEKYLMELCIEKKIR